MHSSVSAIRGARPRAHFARPSGHHRDRRLGLAHPAMGRSLTAARTSLRGRSVGILALRREPRMTWARPSAAMLQDRAGGLAALWRG